MPFGLTLAGKKVVPNLLSRIAAEGGHCLAPGYAMRVTTWPLSSVTLTYVWEEV